MSFSGLFPGHKGMHPDDIPSWHIKVSLISKACATRDAAEGTCNMYRQGANGIKEHAALFTDFAGSVDFCSSVLPRVMPGCWGLACWSPPGGEPGSAAASSSAATGWSDLPEAAKLG